MNAGSFGVFLVEGVGMEIYEGCGQKVSLCELNKRDDLILIAVVQTQIDDDLLNLLWLVRVLVVVDNVVLQNVIWQLPV